MELWVEVRSRGGVPSILNAETVDGVLTLGPLVAWKRFPLQVSAHFLRSDRNELNLNVLHIVSHASWVSVFRL